ncbi:MAG: PAS domain-containing protein [Desulfobacteraceae bacterium]|nr:PAS domain-containing protein [Desulfobacteraceae bacterium]
MRLRLILLVLSLLAFLSVSTGGFLYYSSLKEAALKKAERHAVTRMEMIKKNLTFFLSGNIRSVNVLAGMKELGEALSDKSINTLARANAILDHFKSGLNVDVCYLTDHEGNTIGSSNRYDTDSFVGENFTFRPYFQNAIQGIPATYLALGTTSEKRGAYNSHPVYIKEKDAPVGVAVIKTSVELIENELNLGDDEIVLVTDSQGIVFISSRKDWLCHTLYKLSDEEISRIAESKQFGSGPWNWIGLEKKDEKFFADISGNKYLTHSTRIDNHPGWNIIHLQGLKTVSKSISDPLIRITGHVILALCVLVGLSVFVLYKKAAKEIIRRRTAEMALRKREESLKQARDELSRYSKDLERQVKKRTEEITSILRYTPDVVYIKDSEERYLMVNPCYEEIFGIKNEEIRGKTAHEIMKKDIADQIQVSDKQVLLENKSCRAELEISLDDGIHTYLSVKFPIYDEAGEISGVGGISTDITELKKAQKQLHRLSGSIMENQEKERSAIARELHDELGQMLTALRMDAVWLHRRLKEKDSEVSERALTMCSLIDKTIEDVRSIAIRLRPGVLDDLGLVDALEWYTASFERRTEITCIYEHSDVPGISDLVATAAYRIAQEALTNVARHARATRADVALKAEDNVLKLTVLDNGCGFYAPDMPESGGLGIAGMRERAGLVGGILEVESLPGEGTRVYFELTIGD